MKKKNSYPSRANNIKVVDYKDFEKNGFGKFTHFSGETYAGNWQNNVSVIDAKKLITMDLFGKDLSKI